jgi:tetratricopeptide (TPR) repeat protein
MMSVKLKWRTAQALLLVLAGLPAARGRAQAPAAIGAAVVIRATSSLRIRDAVVATGEEHRVYKVERANGPWLWLVAGPVAGWALERDVMTLDEAVQYYSNEIQRDAHDPRNWYNRGLIHQDRGKPDQAFADYSAALRQNADYVPALINRGKLWFARRSVDRAITDYSDAVKAEPRSIAAHLNRAIAWQAKGELDYALSDYDVAIRLGLRTASLFNSRGQVRALKLDHGGAIADFSAAIAIDPKLAVAWTNRGSAHEARAEFEPALADFTAAARLDPRSPLSFIRRAWIRATCREPKYRDGKAAVALAVHGCELAEKPQAAFFDTRAAAHAQAGDFAEAVFWETRAIGSVARPYSVEADTYRARLKLYQQQKPYRDRTAS